MAVSSYNAIASVTLSSNQAQVTFSNIPQIYTDLVLVVNSITSTASEYMSVNLNGDARTNYSRTSLSGNGTTASSYRASNETVGYFANDTYGTNTYKFNAILHFMNYSNTTVYKTFLSRANQADLGTDIMITSWRKTEAINSIKFNSNFATGTTFTLYGVGANTLKASGGDIIVSDGTYWYHAFLSSGTFTPLSALTCHYLVVAGGGGSGQGAGSSGGGGAGGLRSTVTATGGGGSLESALSLSANVAYTVTIGAGGAGGAPTGVNGSDSTFSTITSTGGGRSGGANPNQNGASGGSGGGGGEQSAIYGTGGAGTANQGYAGGTAAASPYRMAGGGGAGAVGVGGGAGLGTGGAGVLISALATPTGTGLSGYYAGGGGGAGGTAAGVGGVGGGGNGGTNVMGTSGYPNTGGGAGGSYVAYGTPGGSGIVIVRYAV